MSADHDAARGGQPAPGAALAAFERMLAAGKDSALLRYSIGNEHMKARDWRAAIGALERSVALDPGFTAAWKLYAKALDQAGEPSAALDAYRKGIEVAQRKGDRQAEKEMTVFARRIERTLGAR
ncbi:MAG TPA: tetratricopeptide repeat protein [Casimicrobiaceae bacterium]|nr:tetratricopeptide repeat protein [Casimicrobiaceae bacterium]